MKKKVKDIEIPFKVYDFIDSMKGKSQVNELVANYLFNKDLNIEIYLTASNCTFFKWLENNKDNNLHLNLIYDMYVAKVKSKATEGENIGWKVYDYAYSADGREFFKENLLLFKKSLYNN